MFDYFEGQVNKFMMARQSMVTLIFFLAILFDTAFAQVTWTKQVSGVTGYLYSVKWIGTQLVAVGENGVILTSPNGMIWTSRVSGTTGYLYSVTGAGTQLVAVGSDYPSSKCQCNFDFL